MKRVGRPPKKIDHLELFGLLVYLRATNQELAEYFKCSVDTLDRAIKKQYGDHASVAYFRNGVRTAPFLRKILKNVRD